MKIIFLIFVFFMTMNLESIVTAWSTGPGRERLAGNRCPTNYRYDFGRCVPTWCRKIANGDCI